MSESEECIPCRIGKNVCRLLKDGEKRCQEIYDLVYEGKISGVEGSKRLIEAFGAEKVTEALKLGEEIEKRGERYKESMATFLGDSE